MTELTLKLDDSSYDNLTLQILYEGYLNCYYWYKQDLKVYNSDPCRYAYKLEDINSYYEVLEAYERLARHYAVPSDAASALKQIRDEIDYGDRLIQGMSQHG